MCSSDLTQRETERRAHTQPACPLPSTNPCAMAGDPPPLKRPKLDKEESSSHHRPSSANGAGHRPPSSASASASTSSASDAPPPPPPEEEDMAEEAVLALIAHRERVVEQYKLKLAQYQSLVRLPLTLSLPLFVSRGDCC